MSSNNELRGLPGNVYNLNVWPSEFYSCPKVNLKLFLRLQKNVGPKNVGPELSDLPAPSMLYTKKEDNKETRRGGKFNQA